jgi:hypothetical protein
MSAAQRAVLLWRRLTALGLEAWPAALARNHTHQIDWDRPMPSWLDHLIVLVPRQDGVDAPIWLDPECWWCAVGDLPHWSANAQVLVLDYDSKRRRLEAGRRTAMGSAPVRTLREEVFTGTLTGTGDFSGEWMQRHTGVAASALRRAGQNDPGVLKDRLGAGATVGPMAHACELSAGRCSRRQTFSVSGYATRMGDRWVIPLRAFHNPGWLDDLAPSKRKAPFRIFGPQREYRQRFEIQLPPGSALRSAPAPMTVENTMGRMTFRAWAKGSRLMVERTLALNPKTHPPEKWGALRPPFNLFRRLRDAAIIVGPKPSP